MSSNAILSRRSSARCDGGREVEVVIVLLYDGDGYPLEGRDPVAPRVDTFESAIEKLGCIAEVLSSLAQSGAEAVARIESAGGRIDHLNAENRALLDDFQQGKW